jgi:RNA polymerase sigma-70 factor, ECF subfamily
MDASTFEEMYRAHYTSLRNAAWSMIGDKDAAHDLVQEVFVKLWGKLGEMDAILNQKAYLLRAVMNASLTYIEKNKRTVEYTKEVSGSSPDSDTGMMFRELQASVQAALDRLPPKCRAIFVLSRFEEKSYKEIAAILGLSIKTVENQMGIALKKLREDLRPFLSKDYLALVLSGSLSWLAFCAAHAADHALTAF